jgi:5-keto 4-deoxyuronate isomerase
VEAIYSIKTDDGVYIHIRNRGIIANSKDAQGNPSFYFRCAPQFEAPNDSKYAWLNNSLFLCAPSFSQGFQGIVLNVWRVK